MEEENEVTTLLRQQCLVASSDDPEDIPGYNAAFMSSLNDHKTWEGNIEDVIAMSICGGGRPLVRPDVRDSEADPSGAVKDGLTDWD
jgi:hypothetical protein